MQERIPYTDSRLQLCTSFGLASLEAARYEDRDLAATLKLHRYHCDCVIIHLINLTVPVKDLLTRYPLLGE
jgi:hypothetical protein